MIIKVKMCKYINEKVVLTLFSRIKGTDIFEVKMGCIGLQEFISGNIPEFESEEPVTLEGLQYIVEESDEYTTVRCYDQRNREVDAEELDIELMTMGVLA